MKKKRVALYARVSTDHQSTESQNRQLHEYCKSKEIADFELFSDHGISGAKESRPALNRMMDAVENDEVSQVIVFSFSRFARSTTHLLKALQRFKAKGVGFVSLTEKIDTDSPMGVAMFTILGALSQMEREIIAQRVKAGLANASAKGRQIGRKKTRPSELIRKLKEAGFSQRKIASIAKVSHSTVNAEMRAWEKEKTTALAKEIAPDVVKEHEDKQITANSGFESKPTNIPIEGCTEEAKTQKFW